MLNLLVVEELEAELVTSLDVVGGNSSGFSALVAPQVGRVDDLVGERRHVGVGVLTGVSIVATDSRTVDDEAVEDVVGIGPQGRKQSEKSNRLHVVEKRVNMFKRSESKKLEKRMYWLVSNASDCDGSYNMAPVRYLY